MNDLPCPRLDVELHRKLCEELLEIRFRFPDLRLGQLISNLTWDADTSAPVIEDWDLLAAADRFLDRHMDRTPEVPVPALTPGAA